MVAHLAQLGHLVGVPRQIVHAETQGGGGGFVPAMAPPLLVPLPSLDRRGAARGCTLAAGRYTSSPNMNPTKSLE